MSSVKPSFGTPGGWTFASLKSEVDRGADALQASRRCAKARLVRSVRPPAGRVVAPPPSQAARDGATDGPLASQERESEGEAAARGVGCGGGADWVSPPQAVPPRSPSPPMSAAPPAPSRPVPAADALPLSASLASRFQPVRPPPAVAAGDGAAPTSAVRHTPHTPHTPHRPTFASEASAPAGAGCSDGHRSPRRPASSASSRPSTARDACGPTDIDVEALFDNGVFPDAALAALAAALPDAAAFGGVAGAVGALDAAGAARGPLDAARAALSGAPGAARDPAALLAVSWRIACAHVRHYGAASPLAAVGISSDEQQLPEAPSVAQLWLGTTAPFDALVCEMDRLFADVEADAFDWRVTAQAGFGATAGPVSAGSHDGDVDMGTAAERHRDDFLARFADATGIDTRGFRRLRAVWLCVFQRLVPTPTPLGTESGQLEDVSFDLFCLTPQEHAERRHEMLVFAPQAHRPFVSLATIDSAAGVLAVCVALLRLPLRRSACANRIRRRLGLSEPLGEGFVAALLAAGERTARDNVWDSDGNGNGSTERLGTVKMPIPRNVVDTDVAVSCVATALANDVVWCEKATIVWALVVERVEFLPFQTV